MQTMRLEASCKVICRFSMAHGWASPHPAPMLFKAQVDELLSYSISPEIQCYLLNHLISLRKNGGCWDRVIGWKPRCLSSLDNLCKVQWALLSVWSVAAPVGMGLLDTNLEAAVNTFKIPNSQPPGEERSVQRLSQTVCRPK